MIKVKNKDNITILIYTLFFCITAFCVYYGFWEANKTLIWQIDGFKQHFPAMYELRESLRTILRSGFKEIPFWNWNLGLGLNLSFIYTYDMFYWFAIFLPEKLLVDAYGFFIIIKLYLAGLFLIIYLKQLKIDGYSSIIGGLVYAFSGYALYAGIRHPFFVSPMAIFPLIILGIENYLVKKKSKILILSVFIATISHYYFLYMMGIGMIIYTIIRNLSLEEKTLKQQLKNIFNVGIRSILGVGMGAFAILPNIYMFFVSNREGAANAISLIYNKSYYASFVTSFINPELTGNWTVLMFAAISIIMIPLIFTNLFNGFEYITRIFIVMTAMLLIPFIGSAMNGFSDVSNRWVFMYSFFVSVIVSIGISKIKLLEKKHFIVGILTILIYIVSITVVRGLKLEYIISDLFLIIMLIIMFLIKGIKSLKSNNIAKVMMIFIVISNISYIANYYFIPQGSNYSKEFVNNNGVLEKYFQNTNPFKKVLISKKFFRTDQSSYGIGSQYGNDTLVSNDGLVSNINSSGQYISMMDKNIYEFYKENGEFNIKSLDSIIGYDDRSILESLLSVKYKITNKNNESYLGKGYELINKKGAYKLYENKNVLPLGIFYSDYISKEDYINLPEIDKSMALLQGIVFENNKFGEKLNKIEPKLYSNDLDYQINKNGDIEISGNKIVVKKENSELILTTNIPLDSEIYLDIDELDKKDNSSKSIYVSRKGLEKKILLRQDGDIYDTRNKNELICLGYTSGELKDEQIKLRFANKGTYTFDQLRIKTINMADYDKYIQDLKNQELNHIKYGNNYVKGNINAETSGVMFFSIPYNKGWKAEVDGKGVETLKTDTGFIGIPLEKGNHSISLSFYPPGLNLGLFITFMCLLVLAVWYYLKKNKTKLYDYI